MWIPLIAIYFLGVPVAFVIGCILRRPADAKKDSAGFVACEAIVWPLLLVALYVAIPFCELICLAYDRLVWVRRK
ncbi:hypothetical protein AB6848_20810 [Serratia proteamaculans]|jgi:hypothetical protein|uniref:hypothetical protein n=1 Tax=Serratia proteamaculans TaxID=28151 RepID=UPI0021790197|nr:hypothetical protein [Serratia proteamaculans]CAI1572550.1 Uncharacterised protein [Serratia proteamaculans]